MFNLIKEEDYEVLAGSNFAKNAMFYKDMLAFCNAFDEVTSDPSKLPNFCFLHTKELCLEGICLLIKMYATEFKLETIKLSLEYLKILYYAVASYSKDGKTVNKDDIIAEFEQYRKASIDFCNEHKEEITSQENEHKEKIEKHKEMLKKSDVKKTTAKTFNALYIIMFVFSFMGLAFPALCAIYETFSTGVLWGMSIGILVVGISISYALKFVSKKLARAADDMAYEAQVFKKGIEEDEQKIKNLKDQYNKILCEKYEYKWYFTAIFSHYGTTLPVDEILRRAKMYRLLTYNVVHDVKNLFRSQQEEIDELVAEIENLSYTADYQAEFADIYKRIMNQDWLYFNQQVRLHYIKKFTDICEKSHVWKLEYNDDEIDPFEVDVRGLSRENVAFLKASDRKFVTAKLIDFMQTSYVKNLRELEFTGNYTAESLKTLKSNYLRTFYIHEVMQVESNGSFAISDVNLEEAERIPTYISLKFRLIENAVGLGNSDARVIRQMAENMFGNEDDGETEISETFSAIDIEYPETDCDSCEIQEDQVVYHVNGKQVIGHKIN